MQDKKRALLEDLALMFSPQMQGENAAMPGKESKGLDGAASARELRALNQEEWKSLGVDIDYKESNGTGLCAMKRRGISHIRDQKPCQDNYKVYKDDSVGLEIVAIADGHGDKKHDLSEFGSAFACEALVSVVCEKVGEPETDVDGYFKSVDFKIDIINRWKEKVSDYHKNLGEDSADDCSYFVRYGTTLLFAVHYRGKFYVGRLGDGGIVLSAGDEYFQMFAGDEKIGTSTCSLCMNDAYMYFNIKVFSDLDFDSIMLMTDGMFDIFESDEYLFKNMKSFTEGMELPETERNGYFSEKYNQYVDYIMDDTTVGIIRKGEKVNPGIKDFLAGQGYLVGKIQIRENTIRVELTRQGKSYIAVLGSDFFGESDLDGMLGLEQPVDMLCYKGRICLIYEDEPEGDYKNIYSLIDDMIKSKRRRMEDDKIRDMVNKIYTLSIYADEKIRYSNISMLFEMTEYSDTAKNLRILGYKEKQNGEGKSINDAMLDLLVTVLAGSRLTGINVNKEKGRVLIKNSKYTGIVADNLARVDNLIDYTESDEEDAPELNGYYCTDDDNGCETKVREGQKESGLRIICRCKKCGTEMGKSEGVGKCRHCGTEFVPKAILSVADTDICQVIFTNESILIENGNSEKTHIETMYHVESEMFGIRNMTEQRWQVFGGYVNPGEVKSIKDRTEIKAGSNRINVELL